VHKKKYGSRVIYDIHDATYDISPGVFPLMYSKMLMNYEYKFIQNVDTVLSVGEHLLKWVQLRYGLKQPCIPMYSCNEESVLQGVKSKKYVDNESLKIYYHGLAYPARKLDVMVKALPAVEGIELVFRCDDNEYVQNIKQLAIESGVATRVRFLPMVAPQEVIVAANRDGDIGIYASDPNSCVNWASSFTNKFVEYLGAGLPIITTMAEDQMRIVKENRCGFILENSSVECMEDMYRHVLTNRKRLRGMSRRAWRVARTELNWTKLENRLVDVVLNRNVHRIKGRIPALSRLQKEVVLNWNEEDAKNYVSYDDVLRRISTP